MRTRTSWLIVALVLGHGTVARAQTIEYYALDAVGSVRVVFDASGTIVGRMDFGPFGQELIASTGKQKNVYAGLFAEGEAGLDYAEARMYQARTGRLNVPDPILAGLFEPQRWNRYTYALNSPLTYIDPSGFDPCPTHVCFDVEVRARLPREGAEQWIYDTRQEQNQREQLALQGRGSSSRIGPFVPPVGPTIGPVVPPTPTPTPTPKPKPPRCSDSGGGILWGYGGAAEIGGNVAGASGQGSVSVGVFLDSRNGFSDGTQFSGAITVSGGDASRGLPTQARRPVVAGAYAGAGPVLTITNARSMSQMGGPFTTYSLNLGVGPVKGSLQFSTAGDVWALSVSGGTPILAPGAGVSISRVTTYTAASSNGGCR